LRVTVSVGLTLVLLTSLSVNVVVVLEPGAPAFGVLSSATRTTEMFTLSLHAALPISLVPPLRPLPLNVPVVPPLLSVMVSVSVEIGRASRRERAENGGAGASEDVVCPATVPLMVGAPAGSVLITVVLLLTVGVALALLRSLSVNVVVVLEPGAPAFGVKTSASSSLVMVAAAAAANV